MKQDLAVLGRYLSYRAKRFHTREQLERFQERAVRRHLAYVSAHSPFYRAFAERSLSDFPEMDKQLMNAHFDELNTLGLRGEETMEFALQAEKSRDFQPRLHGVTVGLSSGTSHSRGIFLVSDQERAAWAGYVLARFLPEGLLGTHSIAFFMRANSNLYEAVSSKNIRFTFFDIYGSMEMQFPKLEDCAPEILVGQPSVLLALSSAKQSGQLRIAPRLVISIAEVLEPGDAAVIRDCFGVEVVHQVYQCTEGCLATSCSHGTLHLNEDLVKIDRDYLDERRFVPIITDFNRRAQPVIRYRLNDILVERVAPCPCGSPFLALEKIEGREDDVFRFRGNDGGEVSVFPDFIRRCVLFAGEITNYRIVQGTDGNLTVYTDAYPALCERIREELLRLAEDRRFLLPMAEFLPYRTEPGKKLKRVECLLANREKGSAGK